MAVRLDHIALAARDARESAQFLVDDDAFDAARARLDARGVVYYPGPGYRDPGTVNHHHGGRGLYVDDPGGRHFQIITRRYEGSPGRYRDRGDGGR